MTPSTTVDEVSPSLAPSAARADPRVDRLVRLAARALGAPVAALWVLRGDRLQLASDQGRLTLKSAVDVDLDDRVLFLLEGALLSHDVGGDPRPAAGLWAELIPGIRGAAIAPIISGAGRRLGVLAILDMAPRAFGPDDAEALVEHAALLSDLVDPARRLDQQALELLKIATAQAGSCVMITEVSSRERPGARIVYVNEAFTKLTGYPAKDIMGRSPHGLQGSNTSRAELGRIAEALARGEPATAEIVTHCNDGSQLRAECSLSPLRDGEGRLTHIVTVQHLGSDDACAACQLRVEKSRAGLERLALEHAEELRAVHEELKGVRDELETQVAERTRELLRTNDKLASELGELRRAEVRYEMLIQNFPDGALALFDRDLRFMLADGPALAGLGLQGIVGKTLRETSALESSARLETLLKDALTGKKVVTELLLADKTYLVQALPVKQEGGEITAGLAVTQDITERAAAETLLRVSEECYRLLFEKAGEAICILVAEAENAGMILEANTTAAVMHGYTPDELRGMLIIELDAPDSTSTPANIRRVGNGEWIEAETTHMRKDGSLFPVEYLTGPLNVEGVRFTVVITRDITDRKRAEAALKQAKREADAASRAKSAFFANMSHEMRTPMHAILGYTQLLRRDPELTREQQQRLDVVSRSGEHLLLLINDLLEMSKSEAERRRVSRRNLDLRALLDELERVFAPRANEKQLILAIYRSPDLPRYIMASEGKLRQVLTALLDNAVKFTRRGAVMVRVLVQTDGGGEARLKVEVEDTGPGIDEKEVARLFRPFEQARVGIEAQGGTGLGLALSREFARLLGGDITVESRLDRGSLFRLDVPIEIGHAEEAGRPAPRGRVIGMASAELSSRILLVDDDDDGRIWARQLLGAVGFDVREAKSEVEALAALKDFRPHLVLLDVSTLKTERSAVIRAIRARPSGRQAAIVAMTPSAFDDERDALLEAGADGVLRKPCREAELLSAIQEHVGVEYQYAEAQSTDRRSTPLDLAMIRHEHVRRLSPDLVAELRAAAHVADYDRLVELIPQVPREHAAFARALRELVERYSYGDIESIFLG